MSTVYSPFGLTSADYIGGKPRQTTFVFPIKSATNSGFFNGDAVSLSASTDSLNVLQTPNSLPPTGNGAATAANQVPLGVFVEVKYQPVTGAFVQNNQWTAGTLVSGGNNADAYIAMDPMQVYLVQCNAATFSATNPPIGEVFNLAGGGAGNTTTGQSRMYLDATAGGYNTPSAGPTVAGVSGHVRIIGLAPFSTVWGENNWDDAYPVVKVVFNNHFLKPGQYSL